MIDPFDISVWGYVFFREPEDDQQLDPNNPLNWIEGSTILDSPSLEWGFEHEITQDDIEQSDRANILAAKPRGSSGFCFC